MIFAARRKPCKYRPNQTHGAVWPARFKPYLTRPFHPLKSPWFRRTTGLSINPNKKGLFLFQSSLGCGQTGGRDAVGRATHISQAQRVAELDGSGVAAVFTADAQLDVRAGGAASSTAIFISLPTPFWSMEAKTFFLMISSSWYCGRKEPGSSRLSPGPSGSGHWCRRRKNWAVSAISSAVTAAPRDFNHGADEGSPALTPFSSNTCWATLSMMAFWMSVPS